jgi:hypothetical protein
LPGYAREITAFEGSPRNIKKEKLCGFYPPNKRLISSSAVSLAYLATLSPFNTARSSELS